MVSGMNFIAPTIGAIVGLLIIHLMCKWNYIRGRAEGMRDEALAWCAAFDQIKAPNWQSLPIPVGTDREKQEAANKLYVEVFKTAKEVIGQELVMNRIDALQKEWGEMGLLPTDIER